MHGIKIAEQKSGLSAHVIRMWEKRYNAVTPARTDTNRRLYDDSCILRLKRLAHLTHNGHSIGQIAYHDDATLSKLVEESATPAPSVVQLAPQHKDIVEELVQAVTEYSKERHDTILTQAVKQWGYSGMLENILIPYIQEVGQLWQQGSFTTAQEHASTSFIKEFLTLSSQSFGHEATAPKLVVTTPPGQLHELGAVIASSLARKLGWNVIYLGPSTPMDELAGACEAMNARAVLLSIIYPLDDPFMDKHLQTLHQQLDRNIPIIVGSPDAPHYKPSIDALGLHHLHSMQDLQNLLSELRQQPLLSR